MFYSLDLTHLFVHKDYLRGNRAGEALFSLRCEKRMKHSRLLTASFGFEYSLHHVSVLKLHLWIALLDDAATGSMRSQSISLLKMTLRSLNTISP